MKLNKISNVFSESNIARGLIQIVISITLCLVLVFPVEAVEANDSTEISNEQIREIIEGIINWKKESLGLESDASLFSNEYLQHAGDSSGDWYPIGMGRVGYEEEYDSYLAVIKDVVEKRYAERNKLSKAKATEWHRISLAILATGGNPREIGIDEDGNTIDLISDGTFNRGETRTLGAQGLNGWSWALLALDSLRYEVPDEAYYSRKDIIENILSAQLTDGGFALMLSEKMDIDITAMVLQSLAPYYNSEEKYTYTQSALDKEVTKSVREVVDEALTALSEKQSSDGEFASWDTANAESTVQVIVALTSLGINPLTDERFIKYGENLIDVLLRYRMDDGGFIHSFSYDSDNPTSLPDQSNSLATEQALYGFVSLLRYIEGYRSLYDFREEWDDALSEKITRINEGIELLPVDIGKKDRQAVTHLFEQYLDIPISERVYIRNYKKLAKALEILNIENKTDSFSKNMGEIESEKGRITPIFDQKTVQAQEVVFTEEDESLVNRIPEAITTEYEVEVIKLLERLQNAKNKTDYEHMESILQDKNKQIEVIKAEIKSLNDDIMQQLYPFENIKLKDKENVDKIMERYEQLSSYDQEKISNYEDVEKTFVQIKSLQRARYITIATVIVVIGLLSIVIVRIRKRKKAKQMNE